MFLRRRRRVNLTPDEFEKIRQAAMAALDVLDALAEVIPDDCYDAPAVKAAIDRFQASAAVFGGRKWLLV